VNYKENIDCIEQDEFYSVCFEFVSEDDESYEFDVGSIEYIDEITMGCWI